MAAVIRASYSLDTQVDAIRYTPTEATGRTREARKKRQSIMVVLPWTWGASSRANKQKSGTANSRSLGYVKAVNLPRLSKDPDTLLRKVVLYRGDITELDVDVIVNAANPSLLGGGGVDGAIHRKAGPQLRVFNQTLGGCKTSEVKASPAFQLLCKQIFHTVGPRGEQPQALRACYLNALELLKKSKYRTIAFPCISTGIYGYPQLNAAQVVTECVTKWLKIPANYEAVDFIVFCVFERQDFLFYEQLLSKIKIRAPVSIASVFAPRTVEAEGQLAASALEDGVEISVSSGIPRQFPERGKVSRCEEGNDDAGSGRHAPAEGSVGDLPPWGGSWVLCGGAEDATREEEDGTGEEDDRTRVFPYKGTKDGMELQSLNGLSETGDTPEESAASPEPSCGGLGEKRGERGGGRSEEEDMREGDTGATQGRRPRRQVRLTGCEAGKRHKRRASVDEDDEVSSADLSDECPAARLVEKQEDRGERRSRNGRKEKRGKPERPKKKEITNRRISMCFDRHQQERIDAEQRLRLESGDTAPSTRPAVESKVPGDDNTLPPPLSAGDYTRLVSSGEGPSLETDEQGTDAEKGETKELKVQLGVDDQKSAAPSVAVAEGLPQEPCCALEGSSPSCVCIAEENQLQLETEGADSGTSSAFPSNASAAPAPSPETAGQSPAGSSTQKAACSCPTSGKTKGETSPAKQHKRQSAEEKKKGNALPEGKRKGKQTFAWRGSQSFQESPPASVAKNEQAAFVTEKSSESPRKRGGVSEIREESQWNVTQLELPPVNPLAEGPQVAGIPPDVQSCATEISGIRTPQKVQSAEPDERSNKRPISSVTPRSSDSSGGARPARKQRQKKHQSRHRKTAGQL
ncbi:UNVERIFIED_CONTAM: macro domain-containing protein [Hammondia hammondi]|eukprot:XP_008887785.1 macro domain-containing protein [Hammondia hammondi]